MTQSLPPGGNRTGAVTVKLGMRHCRGSLIAGLGVTLLAAACGAGGGGADRVHSGEVASGVGQERLQAGDAQSGAAVVNRFGVDLLAPELGEGKGNVALSPWSVATALGMVRAGAAGTTAGEIDRVLHVDDPSRFHQAMKALAQELIEALAACIPDPALHDHFLQQATALLPRPQPLSPRRAAKRAFGGLTQREREVAALIAQGKSNREIADVLVVNYRTIEAHVSNILSKLGLTSRAQIAVWATEKGLRKTEQQSL